MTPHSIYEVVHGPSFSMLKATLSPGQRLSAEAGAMVARAAEVTMRTRLNAPASSGPFGLLWAFCVALLRRALGRTTFFLNDFSASARAEVLLAPRFCGHIVRRRLEGQTFLLWSGAFLACTDGVSLRVRWAGLRGLFSKSALFTLEASGKGDLFFAAYGGIEEVEVLGDYVVDTGHLVAFESSLSFELIAPGGGLLGLIASSEGIVCRFHGRGRVYLQARNVNALVDWISPLLP